MMSNKANVSIRITRKTTHLITASARIRTHKVRQAAKYPKIKIVTHQWLLDSISKWQMQDEAPYLVDVDDADRRRANATSSAPSSLNGSEDSDETASEIEDSESVPASQEEQDDSEGLLPNEVHSPVDGLNFDWGEVDEELKEFMGSDSENDSDTSVSSKTSVKSSRGKKREHEEITAADGDADDDSDEGSMTAKKARVSNSRSTSLKEVKTPSAESSLPTPVEDDDDDDEDDEDWGDLEADLEAELEREGSAGEVA
jgi:RNA polymerase II subunit A-like phosphatase